MKKIRKKGIKRFLSTAVVSALVVAALGYTFVSSAANTITLASSGRFEYDADGNGEINGEAGDIIFDTDDLVALKDAVTGLNSSLTALQTQHNNLSAEYTDYKNTHTYTDTQYNEYVASHSYTNTQYNDYVSTHSYTNTQYANKVSFPTMTEGSFSFSEAYANSDTYPNYPLNFYNTTDWYLGYLTSNDSFYYANSKAGITVDNNSNWGGSRTLTWYKGPFSGADRANVGNSPIQYSFKYIMRVPDDSVTPERMVSTSLPGTGQTVIMTIADLGRALNNGTYMDNDQTISNSAYRVFGIGGIGGRNSTVANLKTVPQSRLVSNYSGTGYNLAFGGTLSYIKSVGGRYVFAWGRQSYENSDYRGVYWNNKSGPNNGSVTGVAGSTYVIVCK